MDTKNQKPLIVEMEEVKQEIIAVINKAAGEHHLPFYIVETLIAPLYAQVKEAAAAELKAASDVKDEEEVA